MSKYEFQAEINQLLSLIINAFYSNKDIFLRELLSNASDAIDKFKYIALTDTSKSGRQYEIRLHVDKELNTLYIEDNGVGMNKDDMVKCLGTIANSGTKQFMENLKDGTADVNLIGQFGVGFYSCYLVAETVKVYSKKDDDICYVWESNAGGTFTIDEVTESSLKGGTRIELILKNDCLEYLEESKLTKIVKEHCQYFTYPIKLLTVRTETKEEEIEEDEEATTPPPTAEEEDEETTTPPSATDEEKDTEQKPKTKKVEYEVEEWKQLNQEKPLWLRKPEEISKEEYGSFYKSLTNDWEDHLAVKHFKAEGQIEFRAMLYLPKRQVHDMFSKGSKNNNIKLYVKRVFIMDNCDKIVPEWLSCVSGIVDSEDLPLNVSREMLQQNNIMKIIKKNLVKKSIELFNELSEDDTEEGVKTFEKFYENFSKNIKLGIHEDSANRNKLVKLLRFFTANSPDKMISLQQYVNNMKGGQKNIYFITGENAKSLHNTPFVKGMVSKGYDVVFMTEAIDEYITPHITDFDEKKLVNITKDNADIECGKLSDEDKTKYESFCKKIKDTLGDKVTNVTMSSILKDEPCCVTSASYGWTANMERIMKAQTLQTNNMSQQATFMSKKNFELNPNHKMILKLYNEHVNDTMNESTFKNMIDLLFQTSMIASGYTHDDPSTYTKQVYNIISVGMFGEESSQEEEFVPDGVTLSDVDNNNNEENLEEVD